MRESVGPAQVLLHLVGDYAGVEQVRDFDPFRTFEAETLRLMQEMRRIVEEQVSPRR